MTGVAAHQGEQLHTDAMQTIDVQEALLSKSTIIAEQQPADTLFVAHATNDPLSWRFLETERMRELGLDVTVTPTPGSRDNVASIYASKPDHTTARALLGIGDYYERGSVATSLEKFLYRCHGSLFQAQLVPGNRVYERVQPGITKAAEEGLLGDQTPTDVMLRGFMTSSITNAIRFIKGHPHADQLYEAVNERYHELRQDGYRPLDRDSLHRLSAYVLELRADRYL